MPVTKPINLYYAHDGEAIARKISAYFFDRQIPIKENMPPETEGLTPVAVFVLTRASKDDPDLKQYLTHCQKNAIPVIPVVPETAPLDYSNLPDFLTVRGTPHVMRWDAHSHPEGKTVCQTISCYVGLDLFQRNRKFFISYRRKDGDKIARLVHHYFQTKSYQPFLDIVDIAGGDVLNDIIEESILDRDFLLLIDTPDAIESDWVEREIHLAIAHRIKILVLRQKGIKGFSLPPGIMVIRYDSDEDIHQKLPIIEEALISEIHAKTAFDQKVKNLIFDLAKLNGWTAKKYPERQILLTQKIKTQENDYLIEYENAPHSLENLYRLYKGYQTFRPNVEKAFFIHHSLPLSTYQQEAVRWAANQAPLYVIALEEIWDAITPASGGRYEK